MVGLNRLATRNCYVYPDNGETYRHGNILALVMRLKNHLEMESLHCSVLHVLNLELICLQIGKMILISQLSLVIPSYIGSNYDCSREKYYRVLVIDGNFKGDHVRMRNPTDDVELTNGEGYMVEQKRYQDYLSTAKEVKQVCISDQLCCNFC